MTKRRTVLFVISDFLLDGYESPLRTARMKHDVVPVVLRDPMEEAFPALGLVQVEDPETGERALVDEEGIDAILVRLLQMDAIPDVSVGLQAGDPEPDANE